MPITVAVCFSLVLAAGLYSALSREKPQEYPLPDDSPYDPEGREKIAGREIETGLAANEAANRNLLRGRAAQHIIRSILSRGWPAPGELAGLPHLLRSYIDLSPIATIPVRVEEKGVHHVVEVGHGHIVILRPALLPLKIRWS